MLDPVLSLPTAMDHRGASGAEVRMLAGHDRVTMAHYTVPAGTVSTALRHRTIEVLWYVLGGEAEVWRAIGSLERVDRIAAGDSLRIAAGVSHQVRAEAQLTLLATSAPPWPGPEEALTVPGRWDAPSGSAR